jgi:RimJ/RimL family protein N-acetyltransferase
VTLVCTNALGQPVGEPVAHWTPPARPSREPMVGRYCRIEPLDLARHARELYDAHSHDRDGHNWTYLPYGPFATFDAYAAWVAHAVTLDDPLYHAIVDLPSGRAVGVASYLRIDPDAGSIEVGGLAFSPLLQRTRGATEAMYLMMQRAFALGYRRYEWKCDALNAPSRAAAQRLGLSYEGIFRQARVNKGRNRDTAWYATIDREWPTLDRAFQQWLDPTNFDTDGRQKVALSELTRPVLVKIG